MLDRVPESRSQSIPHRGIHAPHLMLRNYPIDVVRDLSIQVLDAQTKKWDAGKAGTITPTVRTPAIVEDFGVRLPVRPRLISSVHGRIERIQLSFPSIANAAAYLQTLYTRFIASFPQTSFVIVTHKPVEADVQSIIAAAGATDRCQIVGAPNYLDFTLWAEDPYMVARDVETAEGTPFFLKPYTFVRNGDDLIADLMSQNEQTRHTQLPIVFQGGNILVGDTFVLVGSDYLAATATLVGKTEADQVVNVPQGMTPLDFSHQLYHLHLDRTREFVFVGTKLPMPKGTTVSDGSSTQTLFDSVGISQPIFHIDMFITLAGRTPAGKYRVVVGSPSMADQLLKRPTLPQSLNDTFDDIATTLSQHPGLEVVRSPLPMEVVQSGNDWIWYYATTNNCIVEIVDEQHKRVWVPQYGFGDKAYLQQIDDYVASMWTSWGFQAIGLGDFNEMAQCSGAANCMKKIIKRSATESDSAPPPSTTSATP